MILFEPGVEVVDVTAPFCPNVPPWPGRPPTILQPPRRIARGNGAPAHVLPVRRS